MLVFARANHWHGSPWHWRVDGVDNVITETSTATPNQPVASSTFVPNAALPFPLAMTWATTQGADLSWVPVPFTQSLSIGYGRTHYGTGYFIYHLYPQGADNLSAPISSWSQQPPPQDVLDIVGGAGTSVAAADNHETTKDVPASGSIQMLRLDGPATIRELAIDAPITSAANLEHAHLVVSWDGRAPSVDAPIALLFGTGAFYDRNARRDIVQALLAKVTIGPDRVQAHLFFPMPFHHSAQISIVGSGAAIPDVHLTARTVADGVPAAWEGYFHATYVDHGQPVLGQDLIALDTTQTEGGGDWCGNFVGMSFIFSDRADLTTLEGDPRFFFDDAESPQAYGTGTEEWAGGGDYWGGQTVSLPLAGHPVGAPLGQPRDAEDAIESAYRFLIADAMPFGKNARIQLEHGALDDSTEHYQTVAYWYGRPSACLERSDSLHIGDANDETAHQYQSPSASAPMTVTSRWDALGGDAEDPATTDTERTMTATSSFTLAIDPANRGVLLRRKLDYQFPDQTAEVWIGDGPQSQLTDVGTWHTAGSTTSVYSNPPGELDAPTPIIQTVDRRWREDELLLPRSLTEGRSSIYLELHDVPGARPVLPGTQVPAQAWSEVRYDAYSYVL
jgi:hypothetical protein